VTSDPRLRFPLAFGAWLALLSVAAELPWTVEWIRTPLGAALAHATAVALHGIGVDATVSGTTLASSHGAVQIVAECDGVVLLCFFAAAVLALPKPPLRAWLPSALAGAAALFALNFGRVLALTATQFWWREAFEWVHFYLLQGLMILATTLVWLAWADRTLRARSPAP
jgi:exosortase/archaeosortase family protein